MTTEHNRRASDRVMTSDPLRDLMDEIASGLLPHMEEKVRKALRHAYFLGLADYHQLTEKD